MFRALFELIITILVVMVARAILTSVFSGLARASRNAAQNRADSLRNRGSAPSPAQSAGDLHKDPVCGTYVAESTPFRRQVGAQNFYYCSEVCRDKHSLARRTA